MGANIIQKSMTVVFTFLYAPRAPKHEFHDTDAGLIALTNRAQELLVHQV